MLQKIAESPLNVLYFPIFTQNFCGSKFKIYQVGVDRRLEPIRNFIPFAFSYFGRRIWRIAQR